MDSRGRLWHQDPDTRHATRQAAADADSALSASLALFQAREGPVCPVREQLFSQAFDEVIREVSDAALLSPLRCPNSGDCHRWPSPLEMATCHALSPLSWAGAAASFAADAVALPQEAVVSPERSLLLLRVRDQYRLSLAAYGAVAMGGVEFGQAARGRVAAGAAASVGLPAPHSQGPSSSHEGHIVERISGPLGAAVGSAGPMALTEPGEAESDCESATAPAEPVAVASGGVTPFAARDTAGSSGGTSGAKATGRASGGLVAAPFVMPRPAAHSDDMPVAPGAPSEGDDPTLEAAVRRLAREVRALQIRVQEGRLTVRAATEAGQRRSAAEEAARMRSADELRKQNALLASVVEQARASLADLDGGMPGDGLGVGAGPLGTGEAVGGDDAMDYAEADAE